jgi:putative ABC transport system permease protein
MHDIRFAVRRLLSRPGFTTLTILTLALGIGASTAVFSVVDQTVLRPAPFAHAVRLVDVINITNRAIGSGGNSLTAAKVLAWQSQPSVFERLEVYAPRAFDVTGGPEPERVSGLLVSTGLFPMLGVQARLGRGFTDDDGRPGSERVVVIAEDLWQRRFGGDADVLGAEMLLNDEVYTIVGVMPRRFRLVHGEREAVWPCADQPEHW